MVFFRFMTILVASFWARPQRIMGNHQLGMASSPVGCNGNHETPSWMVVVVVSNMFYVHPDSWGNDPIWLLPWKLTWQWRIHHLKMYFLLNIVIFQCHVSFQGCNIFELGWNHQLDLPFPWLDDDFFFWGSLKLVMQHWMQSSPRLDDITVLVGNPELNLKNCHWNPAW